MRPTGHLSLKSESHSRKRCIGGVQAVVAQRVTVFILLLITRARLVAISGTG